MAVSKQKKKNEPQQEKTQTRLSPEQIFFAVELLLAFAFFTSLHKAIFAPGISEYLKGFVQQDFKIAVIEGLANLVLILVNLFAVQIILRVGKVRLILLLFLLQALTDILLIRLDYLPAVIMLYMLFLASYNLIWFCINLLVKRYSAQERIHTNQGKVFMISNLGWLLAPALGGWIMHEGGFSSLFTIMAIISLIAFIIGFERSHIFDPLVPTKIKGKVNIIKDIKEFFSNADFRIHYLIYLGLYAYYSVMAIYFPLYLYEGGTPFSLIGITISITMLPFVLLEYPIGKLADKYGNESGFFAIGFFLIAFALSMLGITSQLVHAGFFYLVGSVGSSMIEGLNQSLFLKKVEHHKTAMLGIFNTSSILGWVLGMVISGVLLSVIELPFLFAYFIPIMLLIGLLGLSLRS